MKPASPEWTLSPKFNHSSQLTGLTVSSRSPFGGLVGEMLPKLVNALDDLPTRAQLCGQNAIIDLLVAGFATLGAASFELNSQDQQILFRAKAFIEKHLVDPDLNRTLVAKAVGLSVRRLNEIFQRESTSISQMIQTTRYNRIAADLIDFGTQTGQSAR